jgi:hypothetical protein
MLRKDGTSRSWVRSDGRNYIPHDAGWEWRQGGKERSQHKQEFPQNLRVPVINAFVLSDLLSVRSGIVPIRFTRRKAHLRTDIRGDCDPLDEGPDRWCLCIANNIRNSLRACDRWNRVQHSPSLVQACVEAVGRRKR